MSTTLPNGLIVIDEGNTAWYSDITANWTLLDQKVGTVNALKPVATSGDYNDLTNKPTIPAAANDGTLTINYGGTTIAMFGADDAGNVSADIPAPGDGTLTVTQGGSPLGTFSANQVAPETIDIPAPGDGTLTITVNGAAAGTFTANQASNSTIDIPAPSVPAFATNAEIDALTAEWHL